MTNVIYDIKAKKNTKAFGTVVVTYITDPFNPRESKKVKTDLHGRTLDKYLDGYCLGAKYLVSVNNKLIQDEQVSEYVVKQNDRISYTPIIQGGGGGGNKQIFAMVAMIALSIVAPMAGAYLMGGEFAFGGLAALEGMAFAGGLAITAGIMVAGSLLINSIIGASTSSMSMSTPETTSTTYSWNGMTTSRTLGAPIPVLYGTHALTGTVINSRIYYNEDDDWISTQLSLCHGEIEHINTSDIYINDLAYSSYINTDSITINYQCTDGKFDQPIMIGYNDSNYNNGAASRKLTPNVPFIFQSISNNMNYFRLHMECPSGLYIMDGQGNKSNNSVSFTAQYRKVGTTSWSDLYNWRPNSITEYEYKYSYGNSFSKAYTYFWSSDKNLSTITVAGVTYACVLSGLTRETISEFIPSTTITFTANSSNSYKTYIEPVDVYGNPLHLENSAYEFKVTRTSSYSSNGEDDALNQSKLHVRYLEEIETTNMNYGGIALLGIDIKATDQLNNSRPNFKMICTRKPLYVLNKYVPSTNPAYICLDILTNKHYGMGLDYSKIDTKAFERWAKFCDGEAVGKFTLSKTIVSLDAQHLYNGKLLIPLVDLGSNPDISLSNLILSESTITGTKISAGVSHSLSINDICSIDRQVFTSIPGIEDGVYYAIGFGPTSLSTVLASGTQLHYSLVFKDSTYATTPKLMFNGLMDTTSSVWDAAQEIATIGRGQIILQGNKYSVIYDCVRNVTGLYNASNSNNVTVHYLNNADIASEIEIQYSDRNILYEMNTTVVQDIDAMAEGIRSNKVTKSLKGITSEDEALIMGRYLLACSKFQRKVVTLDADIEAIQQTVGDVVAVQTDVTQYGIGGNIIKRIGNLVTLDNTIYAEYGKTYTLKIKNTKTDDIKDYTFTLDAKDPIDYGSFDAMGAQKVETITFGDFDIVLEYSGKEYMTTNTLLVHQGYEINVGDLYSFGEVNSDSILITITDISREGDLTRKITGLEYNESILDFNYDNDILQRISPTLRPKNNITKFSASDRLVKLPTNQVVSMVTFVWETETTSSYNIYVYEGSFKNYLVMGIKGNRYEYAATELVPEKNYTIYIEDAQDPSLTARINYTITAFSSPPPDLKSNEVLVYGKGSMLQFKITYLDKPLDFYKYSVKLNNSEDKGNFISDTFDIYPEKGTGSQDYYITVTDLIGKTSTPLKVQFTPILPGINSVTVTTNQEYIDLDISAVKGSFDISYYEITSSSNGSNTIFTTKETTAKMLATWSGDKSFTIVAVDVLGNKSLPYVFTLGVNIPTVYNLKSKIDGKDVVIFWDIPTSGVPIDYYEIVYNDKTGTSVSAKTKTSSFRLPVFWGGDKTFNVRIVTTLGSYSSYVSTVSTITLGSVINLQAEVVDNNVLLRWNGASGSLPIDIYLLYKGASEDSLTLIGEKRGTFTTIFENESGIYNYWMSAVDSAGNEGTKTKVTTKVDEPPNYVLNLNYISDFSGTKVNVFADSSGLIIPVNTTDTITQHFTKYTWSTAQDQINAGYPLWVAPFENTGYYEEVYDYGAIMASTMINVIITKNILVGNPITDITISLSSNNSTWTSYSNQTQIYATGFRYIKIKINVTGPNAALNVSNIQLKLDSKEKSDSGVADVVGTDSGGTTVYFNKTFVDITAITVTPYGTSPVIAVYDFVDTANPTMFKVYLYNNSGNRVSGKVSWNVKGF